VKTQRIFCKHFNIARHGIAPCRNTIQLWAENFRTSASVLKKKPPGSVCTVRPPQSTGCETVFIRRSDRRHSVDVGISDRSVRRILHEDLNFHPYKMVEVQELSIMWLQQDGATCPYSHDIPLRDELAWPARSPDLSVCDYFL
ncbi:hypothetical protein B7P43_G06235, partial [Cryptotermes secundus]